ncbi:hypothetical protein Tco_1162122, partial [Tanacetum coccineum]
RHRDLERSYTSRKSVAPVRNRIWYNEEYCSLPPLLSCFQTPEPCATFNFVHHNSNMEVDIDNMTLEEYARYEVTMSSKKNETINTTYGFTSQFFNQPHHTPNPPLDKEDTTLDEILDDLFRIGVENLRKQNMKFHIGVMIKQWISLIMRIEKEEVPMKDDEMDDDVDHSNTNEVLQWSLAKDPFLVCMELNEQSSFVLHTMPSSISNEVKREFKIPHRFSQQGNEIRGHINSDSYGKNVSVWA